MSLNSREIASLFWVAIMAVGVTLVPGARAQLPQLVRTAFAWKLSVGYLLLVGYVVAFVLVGRSAYLWSWDLLKPTIIWFLTTALVMFFDLDKAMKSPAFFRRVALKTIEVPVFLQFVADLYPMSVWIEIPLQGLLILLVLLATVAKLSKDEAQRKVGKGIEYLLGLIGIAVLVASVVQLVRLWKHLSFVGMLKEFILPVWLTLALLPFMFVFALLNAYGKAFTLINFRTDDRGRRWRAKAALVLRVGPLFYRLRDAGAAAYGMVHADSFSEVLGAFDEAKLRRLQAERDELEAKARLVRYAGVKGAGSDGLQLDQREFEETIDALQYLATCHMGHFRNRGRYRSDMLELLGDSLTETKGLPACMTWGASR